MVYGGGNWTQEEPLKYYMKVRGGRHFHPKTEELILRFLKCIRDQGVEEFHKMARCEDGYSYLMIDYEGIYCP